MANNKTDNPSPKTIKNRLFRETHPTFDAEWRSKNRAKLRKQSREFYERNVETERERCIKKYYYEMANNKNQVRQRIARADSKRLSTLVGRLSQSIGNGMRSALKKGTKGNRKWELLVGYSVEQLKNHLEIKFLPGMTWNNYGRWHIDHKIPKSAFNYESPEDIDFKRCWALKNLQPLWAKDNMSKKDKLASPHQPSLLLSLPNEVEA